MSDPYDDVLAALDELGAGGVALLEAQLVELVVERTRTAWQPYPWQTPPSAVPTLGSWLMLGGRGTGKTEGAARYVNDHARGPACDPRVPGGHRMAIVAPSLGDAAESCVNGPTGLKALNPGITFTGGVGGHYVRWPTGAQARIFGAYTPEDVERLRAGGNRCLVWMEEAAAMRHLGAALEHTGLGLRIGHNPHYVISTTPKPRKEIKQLVEDPLTVMTKGTTAEATGLDPTVRERLFSRYGGTRLGRQELEAEILDDTEGALWKLAELDEHRLVGFDPSAPWQSLVQAAFANGPRVQRDDRAWRTLVAVDPPGETAECGITVGMAPVRGAAARDHCVILDDLSLAGPPEVWGAQVVAAVRRYGAEAAIVETNQGGDMVRSTIHNVDPTIPVRKVHASQNKYDRAEPVSALYAKGWVHHAGHFPELEDQLTTWVPTNEKSPDRLDSVVHLVVSLLKPMGPVRATVGSPLGRHLAVATSRP